jgi:hypothetical protein
LKTLFFVLSRARFLLFAFWWGALGAIGAVVVPALFKSLEVKAQAGSIAASLFVWSAQLSCVCACLSVVCALWLRARQSKSEGGLPSKGVSLGLLALLVSAAMLWGIIPQIKGGENRALWHAMGSLAFVLMWLLSGALLILDAKRCFKSVEPS